MPPYPNATSEALSLTVPIQSRDHPGPHKPLPVVYTSLHVGNLPFLGTYPSQVSEIASYMVSSSREHEEYVVYANKTVMSCHLYLFIRSFIPHYSFCTYALHEKVLDDIYKHKTTRHLAAFF